MDCIILARDFFDTGANYHSLIIQGKSVLEGDEVERMKALEIITDNVVQGRWKDVPVGNGSQLKATMVAKFTIDRASVKIQSGGPLGGQNLSKKVWSGEIPLKHVAYIPVKDKKFEEDLPMSKSVAEYWTRHKIYTQCYLVYKFIIIYLGILEILKLGSIFAQCKIWM